MSVAGLWVVDNNRSYSNEEVLQRGVAVGRGCRVEAIGPIRDAPELPAPVNQASEKVARGETVLVEVWADQGPQRLAAYPAERDARVESSQPTASLARQLSHGTLAISTPC